MLACIRNSVFRTQVIRPTAATATTRLLSTPANDPAQNRFALDALAEVVDAVGDVVATPGTFVSLSFVTRLNYILTPREQIIPRNGKHSIQARYILMIPITTLYT